MPKGLSIATNYYNRIEALKDWRDAARTAKDAGLDEVVSENVPVAGDGWRKIDKKTKAIKAELAKAQQEKNK